MGGWVAPRIRDEIVDFVGHYSRLTDLSATRLVALVGIGRDKLNEWRRRYGRSNAQNSETPRNFWIEEWERSAIIAFHAQHPDEGYRRLAYMMLDSSVVAVSPSSVYRVLRQAGAMRRWNRKESKKGTGFHQPSAAHLHWHVDVSYVNICGTFSILFGTILDSPFGKVKRPFCGESYSFPWVAEHEERCALRLKRGRDDAWTFE